MSDGSAQVLEAALEVQAVRNERALCRAGFVFCLIGVVIVGALAVITPQLDAVRAQGLAWEEAMLLSAMGLYVVSYLLLGRNIGGRVIPWVNSTFEATIPVGFVVIDVVFGSAAFGAYVSMGPLVLAVSFALALLRLRWELTLYVGVLAALEYLAVIALGVAPGVAESASAVGLPGVGWLYMRAAVILLIGLVSSTVAFTLRRTVGKVHSEARSQELFGKYRLGEVIASGGMGEVLKATYCPEGGFKKPVAIKRIHAHLAGDPHFVDSFRHEAELGSRLTHANIVQVLDFGQEAGSFFLAMEFVHGTTLRELIRSSVHTPLPPPLVAFIGLRIAQALDFAHAHARDAAGERLRVVHRDLSPNNVLLSRMGEVKVTDFGVAKALGTKEATVTDSIVGKVTYMAPEQISGEPIDVRADLFALGIILWEALCGARLFGGGGTDVQAMARVLSMPIPPPSTRRPELSPEWDTLVMHALERDKEARVGSALAMAEALMPLSRGATSEQLAARVVAIPSVAAGLSAQQLPPVGDPVTIKDVKAGAETKWARSGRG